MSLTRLGWPNSYVVTWNRKGSWLTKYPASLKCTKVHNHLLGTSNAASVHMCFSWSAISVSGCTSHQTVLKTCDICLAHHMAHYANPPCTCSLFCKRYCPFLSPLPRQPSEIPPLTRTTTRPTINATKTRIKSIIVRASDKRGWTIHQRASSSSELRL
jgi:hypothetical protein